MGYGASSGSINLPLPSLTRFLGKSSRETEELRLIEGRHLARSGRDERRCLVL
jgi:hypothetical protein